MESAETIIAKAFAAGQNALSEYEGKRILAAYGIPTTKEFLIDTFAEAQQAADKRACG